VWAVSALANWYGGAYNESSCFFGAEL